MNESEARDGERKQALRYSEKQAKQIEALEKNEKALLALNVGLVWLLRSVILTYGIH